MFNQKTLMYVECLRQNDIIMNLFQIGDDLTKEKRCKLVATLFGEVLNESSPQENKGDCNNYHKVSHFFPSSKKNKIACLPTFLFT